MSSPVDYLGEGEYTPGAILLKKGVESVDILERVKKIIVELLGVDPDKLTLQSRFREDLEADSLDLVELIMAFEEEFEGEISDEDAQKITTVGEAIKYLEAHQKP